MNSEQKHDYVSTSKFNMVLQMLIISIFGSDNITNKLDIQFLKNRDKCLKYLDKQTENHFENEKYNVLIMTGIIIYVK